jgi:hypothetical protein
MCQRSPEIQFLAAKLDPAHQAPVDDIVSSFLCYRHGQFEKFQSQKEFWDQFRIVRYHHCSYVPSIESAAQLAFAFQKRFGNAVKLTPTELSMLQNMGRSQCEHLVREYRRFSKYAFPPETQSEEKARDWRNQALSARQALSVLSGDDAVANIDKNLRAERFLQNQDDSARSERSAVDKSE